MKPTVLGADPANDTAAFALLDGLRELADEQDAADAAHPATA